MNSMIGKSTGIALLMAAALFAALFAMGVFSPMGAKAQISPNPKVTLSNYAPGATDVTLTATFQVNDDLADAATATFTVTGPTGTDASDQFDFPTIVDPAAGTVPDSLSITQDGTAYPDAQIDVGGTAETDVVVTIVVTSEDPTATGAGANDVQILSEKDIVITIDGITNPTAAGHYLFSLNDGGTAVDLRIPIDAATISSQEPGAVVEIKATDFTTEVPAGGSITVDLAGFTVPNIIQTSSVLITNETDTLGSNGADLVSYSGNPTGITVNDTTVTLSIPATKIANNSTVPGDPISGPYSVTFWQSAGISNPTSGGSKSITVTDGDGAIKWPVTINRVVKLAMASGTRGTVVEVTGKGFTSGTSATVYLQQVNSSGMPITNTQTTLGSSNITNGEFKYTMDTSSPDFKVGTWMDGSTSKGVNRITAIDGAPTPKSADVHGYFRIKGKVTLGQTSISHSEYLNIKLSDWSDTVNNVKIGGETAPFVTSTGVTTTAPDVVSMKADFYVQVPASARTGNQTLAVYKDATTTTASGTATIEIGVLELNADPAMAVRGQKIKITGSGFSSIAVDKLSKIEVGASSTMVEVPDTLSSVCEIRSGGQLDCTVTVPIDTTAVRDGENTVKVTAEGGLVGQAKVEIAKAAIELSASESLRGTMLTVDGKGFIAGESVDVLYAGEKQEDEDADHLGNVTVTFEVPASIDNGATALVLGKEYEVKATSTEDGVTVSATAKHSTPKPVIMADPMEATPGGRITIKGQNLPLHATVQEIKIGSTDVTPAPKPFTDGDGSFTAKNLLVPQLTIGRTATIKVKISNVEYDGEVMAVDAPISNDPADVFASLIEADRLLTVWYLDASKQGTDENPWSFYDPDPAKKEFNTLTMVSSGQIVIVMVSKGEPMEFAGGNPSMLYAGQNNIVLN